MDRTGRGGRMKLTHGLTFRSKGHMPLQGRKYVDGSALVIGSARVDKFEALCNDNKHYFVNLTRRNDGQIDVSFPRWGPKHTVVVRDVDIQDLFLAVRGTHSARDGLRPGSNTYEGSHTFAATTSKSKSSGAGGGATTDNGGSGSPGGGRKSGGNAAEAKTKRKSLRENQCYEGMFGAPFKKRNRSSRSSSGAADHEAEPSHLLLAEPSMSTVSSSSSTVLNERPSECTRSATQCSKVITPAPQPTTQPSVTPTTAATAGSEAERFVDRVVRDECNKLKLSRDENNLRIEELRGVLRGMRDELPTLAAALSGAQTTLHAMESTRAENSAIIANKLENPQPYIVLQCMQPDGDVEAALEALTSRISALEEEACNLSELVTDREFRIAKAEEEIHHLAEENVHMVERITAAATARCQPMLQAWVQGKIDDIMNCDM